MIEDKAKARRLLWAKRSAVHYLGSYASSAENLRQILLRRAARKFEDLGEDEASALAEQAVGFCLDNGFLDDTAYAQVKATAGQGRGHSRRRIRMALVAKGVDPDIADEATGQVDDMKAAVSFARKRRFGPWRTKEDSPESRHREAASLGRAGFPGDIAFKIVAMTLEEAEDVLYGASSVPP